MFLCEFGVQCGCSITIAFLYFIRYVFNFLGNVALFWVVFNGKVLLVFGAYVGQYLSMFCFLILMALLSGGLRNPEGKRQQPQKLKFCRPITHLTCKPMTYCLRVY